jgi:outer membrane protein OmpA-like peptidoglycan-associated protein
MSENKPVNILSKISALAAVLLTVNCASYDIDRLEQTKREGYEFSRELANQYQALAHHEDERWDENDASYFAVKGLQASAGQNVLPEDPRQWDVPEDMLEELMHMRHRLLFSLEKSGRVIAPKEAAAAQVGFDCMIDRLSECPGCGDDNNNPAECREMFEKNLTAVEKAVEKASPTFTVYFGEDQWKLTPDAMKMLQEVAKVAANMKKATIDVTGYADAKGGRKHNLVLTQKRAASVANELVRLGVDSRRLITVGAGEVPGPEIMPKHRKVMIHIH